MEGRTLWAGDGVGVVEDVDEEDLSHEQLNVILGEHLVIKSCSTCCPIISLFQHYRILLRRTIKIITATCSAKARSKGVSTSTEYSAGTSTYAQRPPWNWIIGIIFCWIVLYHRHHHFLFIICLSLGRVPSPATVSAQGRTSHSPQFHLLMKLYYFEMYLLL